jgi:hypothetical protein
MCHKVHVSARASCLSPTLFPKENSHGKGCDLTLSTQVLRVGYPPDESQEFNPVWHAFVTQLLSPCQLVCTQGMQMKYHVN